MKELSAKEKVELRKMQMEMAMNGNPQMLIWLGKQHLGQSDNPISIDEELCEGFDIRVIGAKCEDCGKEIPDED